MTTINLFKFSQDFQTFPEGQIILHEGDPGNVMYVIQDGLVELTREGKVIEVLGPGDIFGEMALIDKGPRSTTATAKTECKIVPIDEKRFIFMVEETPFFALQVMRILVARLRARYELA